MTVTAERTSHVQVDDDNYRQATVDVMQPSYPPNERPLASDSLDLVALRTAVGCSRMFLKFKLTNWQAPIELDDALVVVSELVTNAVRATGSLDPNTKLSDVTRLNLLRVRLDALKQGILIQVQDSSSEMPRIKDASDDDEGGRGLAIIDSLCAAWGSYPHPRGKVVWALIPIYPRTESGLPKRVRTVQAPATQLGPQHNPDLLRRVRDGLNEL